MKSNRMIAVLAVFAALMMLLTPFVPMVADADDDEDVLLIGGNNENIDYQDVDLSKLLVEILGNIDDADFADGSGIYDLLGGDTLFDWLKEDGTDIAKENKEISETEIIGDGSTYSLSNGGEYTFGDEGCLVFKSGSVLETDFNFTLTGVGKTIIVLEEGANVSFLGSYSEVASNINVDLNGTFAVKLNMPEMQDIILGEIEFSVSANLSDNGAIIIDGTEIVGNGNDLISVTVNMKPSDGVMAAVLDSDFGSLKKALFDADDDSVFDAKASIDIEKILYGEVSLVDISGELKAGFVKTDSDTKECIVSSGKLSAKAVDKSDNVLTLDVNGSIGITKGDFCKFLDNISNMNISKEDMPTDLPNVHMSSNISIDGKYVAENETNGSIIVDINGAKASFEADIGMADGVMGITGELDVDVDSASADISGSSEMSAVKASLKGVSATIYVDGDLTEIFMDDLNTPLSMIKGGSNVVVDSAKFNIENSTDSYAISIENIKAEYTVVNDEINVAVILGSIVLRNDVEVGGREYANLDAKEVCLDLTQSDGISDVLIKSMSLENKMIGFDSQKAAFENVKIRAEDKELHIEEGVVTFDNFDAGTSKYTLIFEENATLNSTNSVFSAIVLSEGASFNGDLYIKCSGYGMNELKTIDDGVDIQFDRDCSDFRLHYSVDSDSKYEIKIMPDVGYVLPDWETGLKYDKNGILSEFDGTLSVSCEPEEYELTVNGVVKGTYPYGATITLDTTSDGSEINGWKDGTGVVYPVGSDYIMPARDVNLSPSYSMSITTPVIEEDKIVAESAESSLIVPSSTLEKIRADMGDKSLELVAGDATLLIDKSIADGIEGNLYFGVEVKTIFDNRAVSNVVGDNTVYSIRLSGDNGEIHLFPGEGTKAEFSIVYELKEGDTPSTIVLSYLSGDGRLEETDTTVVDNGDGTVLITGSLPHLSDYMVTVKATGEANGMSMGSITLTVVIAAIVIAIAAAAFFLLRKDH